MNVFNRAAMSLLLLAFALVALLVALMPGTVIVWMRGVLTAAEASLNPGTQLVGAITGLVLVLIAVLLLVAELRPPSRQAVVVAQMAGGSAEISNESVALRVKRVAEAVNGIREAVPQIRSHGKSVDIMMRLLTAMDVDIPQKTEEVMTAVREETETRMGIPIRSLRVTVRHSPKDTSKPPAPLSPDRLPPSSLSS